MDIDSVTSPKLGLQFSDSNDFFQESIEILERMGFVSVLSIDMYVKYSFQKTNWDTIIQGAEIDTYDNDHQINDTFFVHKIIIPNGKNITRSLVNIKINQKKTVSIRDVARFLRSLPMVGLIIFTIISLFIPGIIGSILQGINIIALIILFAFYIYKFMKYWFELTKAKSKNLQNHNIVYNNPNDLKIFTKSMKEKIDELQNAGVTDISIDRNSIYLKQDLIDNSKTSIIGLLLGKIKVVNQEKKQEIMESMIDVLSDHNLLDIFKDDELS